MIERIKSESGTTLIETAIASAILLVALVGLLSISALATVYTENHGHLEARTTEYAQDKMEQLLALAYSDTTSNTVNFPATPTGGTGLAVVGSASGSANPATPVNGYVDWLRQDGGLLFGGSTPPTDWYYERVWEIRNFAPGIKQITVTATVRSSFGGKMAPRSTVTALKTSQF